MYAIIVLLACDFFQCLSIINYVVSKREMTVLGDHVECYRHHVCNAVYPCEVCQTWSEKKRAMINKMIECKKLEAAKKSATVTLQKFPLWGTLVLSWFSSFLCGKRNRVAISLGRETKWRQYDTEHFIATSW